jgi:hypothetical protein
MNCKTMSGVKLAFEISTHAFLRIITEVVPQDLQDAFEEGVELEIYDQMLPLLRELFDRRDPQDIEDILSMLVTVPDFSKDERYEASFEDIGRYHVYVLEMLLLGHVITHNRQDFDEPKLKRILEHLLEQTNSYVPLCVANKRMELLKELYEIFNYRFIADMIKKLSPQ